MVSEEGCEVSEEGLLPYALDLINRQEAEKKELKAEIERLESRIFALNDTNKILMDSQEIYWKNRVKEFVHTLKRNVVSKYEYTDIRVFEEIDSLVKEMAGEGE